MKVLTIILLLSTAFFMIGCEIQLNNCLSPEGEETTRIIDLGKNINEIQLNVSVELIVTQGAQQEITIEGAANIITAIESDSKIENDRYIIDIDGCSDTDGVRVFAQVLSIEALLINGSGTIKAEEPFENFTGVDLEIEGSGDITCIVDQAEFIHALIEGSGVIQIEGNSVKESEHNIEGSGKIDFEYQNATEVLAEIEGSGKITGQGNTTTIELSIEGSGELIMKSMIAQDAEVSIQGSGYIEVHADKTLTGSIDGSGSICYTGQPEIDVDLGNPGSFLVNCN